MKRIVLLNLMVFPLVVFSEEKICTVYGDNIRDVCNSGDIMILGKGSENLKLVAQYCDFEKEIIKEGDNYICSYLGYGRKLGGKS